VTRAVGSEGFSDFGKGFNQDWRRLTAEESLNVIPDGSSSQNVKTLIFPQADFRVAMRVDGRVGDSALVDFLLLAIIRMNVFLIDHARSIGWTVSFIAEEKRFKGDQQIFGTLRKCRITFSAART
jgi:hypothetical protein